MQNKQYLSLCLVALVLGQAFALPQQQPKQAIGQQSQQQQEGRKFSDMPMKKVAIDDIDDINTNSIQEGSGTGFSWSNMLGMLMQMLLGQTGGIASPSKNEIDDGVPTSPWANLLSVGLRVLTAILGGPDQQVEGMNKIDNQASSPMQGVLTAVLGAFLGQGRNPEQVAVIAGQATEFINIVINLLDALKTSFSHRSIKARSLGKTDSMSEAVVASIVATKGYLRSMNYLNSMGGAEDDSQRGCIERAMCESNAECAAGTTGPNGSASMWCRLGSLASSVLMQKQSNVRVEDLYEAGRQGRTGADCRALYLDCNAV